MHQASTHSQDEICRAEKETGLLFSGYLNVGTQQQPYLIPVLLRPQHSQEERKAKVIRLNKEG